MTCKAEKQRQLLKAKEVRMMQLKEAKERAAEEAARADETEKGECSKGEEVDEEEREGSVGGGLDPAKLALRRRRPRAE